MSSPEVGGLGWAPRRGRYRAERAPKSADPPPWCYACTIAASRCLEAHAPADVRGEPPRPADHLSTLAFSEAGSRSHFWAPESTAASQRRRVVLNARKSWVTSASHATAYVWSSKPLGGRGHEHHLAGPGEAPGVAVQGPFEGLGLRGNDSCPVSADGVRVPASAMLGADGKGFDIMMGSSCPLFNILNAACSVGFMNAATARTAAHAARTKHSDTGSALADLPTIRNYIARMRVKTDMASALLDDTVAAIEAGRPDAMLRVLECKACAGETANEVLDLAMRVCGGAALPQGSRRGALFPRRASRRSYGADHRCSVRLHRQSRLRLAAFLRSEEPMSTTILCCWAQLRTIPKSS